MGSSDKLPLVEVFFGSPWEAELVKGLLESVGIQAALKNYNMGYMVAGWLFLYLPMTMIWLVKL